MPSIMNKYTQDFHNQHNISPYKWNRLSARVQPMHTVTPAVYKFTASFPQLQYITKHSHFSTEKEIQALRTNVNNLKRQHRSTMKLGSISYARRAREITPLKNNQRLARLIVFPLKFIILSASGEKALGTTSLCQIAHCSETAA